MYSSSNPQLQLAYEFVQSTNRNLFLTGKAGTGKTTFLHDLKSTSNKRMVVVAPTGVAAINAGGVTIHSFFQLSFGPILPEGAGNSESSASSKKFRREKIRLIQGIDLLVIDEISMVRADMLDGIDEVLRRFRDRSKPFGGVQLLMIGDLHQLAPVIKDDEWAILRNYYDSVYFFSSKALRKTDPVSIELRHIYRQSDQAFINLLEKVRINDISKETLEVLNSRHIPGFNPENDEGYIVLTTHNAQAQETNLQKLQQIELKTHHYQSQVTGEFPSYAYPTDEKLALKEGAQVMFVKNDISQDKLYYNGKIGKVTRLLDDVVYVKCAHDKAEIPVRAVEWENKKYHLDDDTKEIKEEVVGSFTQLPLKLAWAITIHKSQGLTFDKAVIDANAAFAHGQVYVALSRCRTFEGLVLSSKLNSSCIKTDGLVANFSEEIQRNEPDKEKLYVSKIAFQRSLVGELFDYTHIQRLFKYCLKISQEAGGSLNESFNTQLLQVKEEAEKEVIAVAQRFQQQLMQLFQEEGLPEEHNLLQERVVKAAAYFCDKTENIILNFTREVLIESDNKDVKLSVTEAIVNIQKVAYIKTACLKTIVKGFSSTEYLKVKTNAELEFKPVLKRQLKAEKNTADGVHSALYYDLKHWREEVAEDNDMHPVEVLTNKIIHELVKIQPVTMDMLRKVKGIGKVKAKRWGVDIISVIMAYHEVEGIVVEHADELPVSPEKISSAEQSFQLFKEGRTLNDIAKIRGLAVSTIVGHIEKFVESGQVDVLNLVEKNKYEKILELIQSNEFENLHALREALGEDYSYAEIRFAMKAQG